jgi:hypothetical protein
MKVILPNNGFGILLMLVAILLIVAVPFALTYWLVGLIAPWWVALPCSLLASLIAFLTTVKFK